MNINELINNYYNELEIAEIFPDENDWEAINDYYQVQTMEW